MEYQSNNESLHFDDSNIITVAESSNNNNVNNSSNDKSDVFQSNTGMFDLRGKNLPPKLTEIKQNISDPHTNNSNCDTPQVNARSYRKHFEITDINNEQ